MQKGGISFSEDNAFWLDSFFTANLLHKINRVVSDSSSTRHAFHIATDPQQYWKLQELLEKVEEIERCGMVSSFIATSALSDYMSKWQVVRTADEIATHSLAHLRLLKRLMNENARSPSLFVRPGKSVATALQALSTAVEHLEENTRQLHELEASCDRLLEELGRA